MENLYRNSYIKICALALFLLVNSYALFKTYPGCSDLKSADFKVTTLAAYAKDSLWEPIKLEYNQVAPGKIDLYWTERRPRNSATNEWGRIRKLDASTGLISEIGRIPTGDEKNGDAGLFSIRLDKQFNQNGWVYVSYVPTTVTVGGTYNDKWVIRYSRFTIKNNKLDLNSETIILEFPWLGGHPGSSITFDDYGNTWMITGNGGWRHEEWSANTAELTGKILRIRLMSNVPDGTKIWGIGKTYTIPVNGKNFGPYWADIFEKQGRTALAAKYRDTSKVRPEVWALGIRSPLSLQLDPVRGWATFGDCGPDRVGHESEEWNVVTHPAFLGFPYWAGNQSMNWDDKGATPQTSTQTPYNPKAAKPVTGPYLSKAGIDSLPPAEPGTYNYWYKGGACALDAVIYRYDPNLKSEVKFPPHVHRAWMTSDWGFDSLIVHQLTEDGSKVVARETWYPNRSSGTKSLFLFGGITTATPLFANPTTVEFGPDGAMYVVNYAGFDNSTTNTSIRKIEYVGPTCAVQPDFRIEKVGCLIASDPKYAATATHHNPYACSCANPLDCNFDFVGIDKNNRSSEANSFLKGNVLYVQASGIHQVNVIGINGQVYQSVHNNQSSQYQINDLLGRYIGVAIIQVKTLQGIKNYKLNQIH